MWAVELREVCHLPSSDRDYTVPLYSMERNLSYTFSYWSGRGDACGCPARLMTDIFWISLGAIVGANLRFAVSSWAANALSPSLPYGTLIVNATGSFVLGFFLIWTSERVLADPHWRLLVAVGFCGAYTTFSSYSFETLKLLEGGNFAAAAGNFLANNMLALLAVLGGAMLARAVHYAG